MRYITASNVSGSFGESIVSSNTFFAVPIMLESGSHTVDQILMKFQYANIKVALYTDEIGYPGAMILSVSSPTVIEGNNTFYNFSSQVLTGGRYWLVCISDRDATCSSYIKVPIVSDLGLDILKNDNIVGYSIIGNYASGFVSPFPASANTLVGIDSIPMIALRETSFTPSGGGGGGGGIGVSGFSGYSGSAGSVGTSGVSGFSGAQGGGISNLIINSLGL